MSNQVIIGPFNIRYNDKPGDTPEILAALYNNNDLHNLININVSSTLVGTYKYEPYNEHICISSNFEKVAFEIFDEIINVKRINPSFAVALADFFFQRCCIVYWNLIINIGSKNQACVFLEKICEIVDKWEKSRKQEIHKGTPYFFLTFIYRELGDIDSAFASAFRAIKEDIASKDPILGVGAYRNSPAFKYVSIKDDKANYLYNDVMEIRKFINLYRIEYEQNIHSPFTMADMDSKFLQGNDRLQQIGHFFVYSIENIIKYKKQMPSLPDNDFYRMKNGRDIFNLSLITDKILEYKYKTVFRRFVPKKPMYISHGIALLFDDKGLIPHLTAQDFKNKSPLKIIPTLPSHPSDLIDKLFINPVNFIVNTRSINDEMKYMLLTYGLRNLGAHDLEKHDVFVSKYDNIIKWLLFSIFSAIKAL